MHLLLEEHWLSGFFGPWCCSARSTSSSSATQWEACRQVTLQHDRAADDCTSFVSLSLGKTAGMATRVSDHHHLQAQQEEHARLTGGASQRSHSQRGMLPLLRRFLILHSSKLLAVAAFAAAMQQPGAIGSILVGEMTPQTYGPPGSASAGAALLPMPPDCCW